MRKTFIILLISVLLAPLPLLAEDTGVLDYAFEFSIERSALEGLSLGEDSDEDRLVEEDYEFKIMLEYEISDQVYLFFTGVLVDETETVENIGEKEEVSGFEREEMGLGYLFGEVVQSELNIGRMEFVSASEWWLWWDEELDGIRLESVYDRFDLMLGLAEEQAPENTDLDDIDPELEDVRRVMLSLAVEVAPAHSLIVYYLDQRDDSASYNAGELEKLDDIDEEDADLTWIGLSYLGEFERESIGEIEIELHAAHVSGDEVLYEFEDVDNRRGEVDEVVENDVRGSAQSFWIGWRPAALPDWRFILGRAEGDGDGNDNDRRDESYRQTDLQGDSESFGELYRPELSNLRIDLVGIEWKIAPDVELAFLHYEYRQDRRAEEMRDVSIENDLTGLSRDLGREIDLILTVEARDGLELIVTAAEFDPGDAYGELSGETANFINLELAWEF